MDIEGQFNKSQLAAPNAVMLQDPDAEQDFATIQKAMTGNQRKKSADDLNYLSVQNLPKPQEESPKKQRTQSKHTYQQKSVTEVDENLLVRDIQALEEDLQRIQRHIDDQEGKIREVEDEYFKRKSSYESAQAELKVVQGKRAEAMKSLNQIALVFEEMKQ